MRALGLGGESGSVKVRDAYIGGAKLAFNVPKYAGLGQHWSLDDDEAADLGAAIEAFVKTLPASQRKRWEKKLEKYWPGLNLVIVAGMITVPRAMATVELAKMKRAQSLPSPVTPYGQQSDPHASSHPIAFDVRDIVERHTPPVAESGPPVPAGGVGEA